MKMPGIGSWQVVPATLCITALPVVVTGVFTQESRSNQRFDVVSVKLNKLPDVESAMWREPGRFVASNISLKRLIAAAYKIREVQVIGGPSWIDSGQFDVVAKSGGKLPRFDPLADVGPLERMLQTLLAERFRLIAHPGIREMRIEALVLARKDGKLGEGLDTSSLDCTAGFEESAQTGEWPGPSQDRSAQACEAAIARWAIRVGGAPMSLFARVLSRAMNRFVVDRTGLMGHYDIDLEWTPPGLRPAPASRPPGNGASLETAVQDQLGLRLHSERGPVPVLVIDSAQLPDPD